MSLPERARIRGGRRYRVVDIGFPRGAPLWAVQQAEFWIFDLFARWSVRPTRDERLYQR